MSAVFRKPDTMVATAVQSRARTPGTSSTGPETTGTAGVGVFVVEEWIEKVFEVQSLRQNHLSEGCSWPVWLPFCLCMPYRVSDEVKDLFFDQLRAVTARILGSNF